MPIYLANDEYEGFLQTTYNPGESVFALDNVPLNVPTIVVSAPGTEYETIFTVTGKTVNSLTGVTRIRGYNGVLVEGTAITCLNNEEFINQYNNVSVPFGGTAGQVLKKNTGDDLDYDWKTILTLPTGGTTGQVLKKKSNADGDAEFGDLVAVSVTTKGDLQTYSDKPDRLPVGNDGEILEARASETTGLCWVKKPTGTSVLEVQVFS